MNELFLFFTGKNQNKYSKFKIRHGQIDDMSRSLGDYIFHYHFGGSVLRFILKE